MFRVLRRHFGGRAICRQRFAIDFAQEQSRGGERVFWFAFDTASRRENHRLLYFLRLQAGAEIFQGFMDDERSEEHTSELQSHSDLVCRLLLEKKKTPI